jgi:hypothetical protein
MRRLVLSFALAACTDTAPGNTGACNATAECSPGQVCLSGVCAKLCSSDRDCAGGQICRLEVCTAGTRDNAPLILSIGADGMADAQTGHTAQHLRRHVTVWGENFEGAAVHLFGAGLDTDLEVCARDEGFIEVALPDGVVAATYSLSVATQAGACDAQLPILQGEPGPAGADGADGSPDTGEQIIGKINAAGGTIDASRLGPIDAETLEGRAAADFAPVAHGHASRALADGSSLNANPGFARGLEGWSVVSGSGTVVEDTSAPSGWAFANDAGSAAWLFGSAVDAEPQRTYVVRGRFKNTTGAASAGNVYLVVHLQDATGATIAGDGSYWHYPIANRSVGTTWTSFEARFGYNTLRSLPAAARTIRVGAALNNDNGGGGNRIIYVTGLSLETFDTVQQATRERIERYHAACSLLNGTTYASVAAVTPGDTSLVLTGTQVCSNYVGNNNITGWTCLGAPYVYGDLYGYTGRYFGTDARTTWNVCSSTYGPAAGGGNGYPFLDPWTGEGAMMICCGK